MSTAVIKEASIPKANTNSPKYQITYEMSFAQTILAGNLAVFARPRRYLIMLVIFGLCFLFIGNAQKHVPLLNWGHISIGIGFGMFSILLANLYFSLKASSKLGKTTDNFYQATFSTNTFTIQTPFSTKKFAYKELQAVRITNDYLFLYTKGFFNANWIYTKYYYERDLLIKYLATKTNDVDEFYFFGQSFKSTS